MNKEKELIKKIAYLARENERLQKTQQRQEKIAEINRRLLKKTNAKLEKALQLAEQANAAKTDFLANISHEIRTPLNIILGMGEAMAGTRLDSSQKKQLHTLQRSGKQLMDILNNVLEFSRIDSGDTDVEKNHFSLKKFLEDLTTTIQPQAAAKGLQLMLRYDPQVIEHRFGDDQKIRQILINMLHNAVKFTHHGEIELRVQHGGYIAEVPIVVFQISDTGIGIRKEYHHTIFDRFSQADSNGTESRSGVGLGLAICSRLIESLGGTIEVTSEVGRGSTFTVSLPLPLSNHKETGRKDRPESRRETFNLPPLKVLIVEDVEENFIVVEQYLKATAIELTRAENGLEALNLLSTGSFDLVLMDIRMPLMNGAAALKRIRTKKVYGKNDLPVIAMTAHAFEEQKHDYLSRGFNEVLTKPFSKKELLTTICKYNNISSTPEHDTILHHSSNIDITGNNHSIPQTLQPYITEVISKLKFYICELKVAVNTNNPGDISELCHSARGLSGMYKLEHMAALVESISSAIKSQDTWAADKVIAYADIHLNCLEKIFNKTVLPN